MKSKNIFITLGIVAIAMFITIIVVASKIGNKLVETEVVIRSSDEVNRDLRVELSAYKNEAIRQTIHADSITYKFIELDHNCDSIVAIKKKEIVRINKEKNEVTHERDSLVAFIKSLQRAN